jgi:hypothetical protein
MPDQHGLGDNGTESTRLRQSGQGDDQMNEYDSEVAHSGNGINTSKTTALRPIWQFAIDRLFLANKKLGRSALYRKPQAPVCRLTENPGDNFILKYVVIFR